MAIITLHDIVVTDSINILDEYSAIPEVKLLAVHEHIFADIPELMKNDSSLHEHLRKSYNFDRRYCHAIHPRPEQNRTPLNTAIM